MIRDEYKKQEEKQKLTLKEAEGIRKLGARGYYSSRIPKMKDQIKVLNFSSWFVLIVGVLTSLMVILTYAFGDDSAIDTMFYVYATLSALMILAPLTWFLIFKRKVNKKIARYQKNVKTLSEEDLNKQMRAYNFLTNTKTEKEN